MKKPSLRLGLSAPGSFDACSPLLLAAALTAGYAAPRPALAQEAPDRLSQRAWIQLGAFRPTIESSTKVARPETGNPDATDVSFEDDLGLPDHKTLPNALLGIRLGGNWRAEFEYFKLDRHAEGSVLTEPIKFGNTTYETSASVKTDFASKVYRLSGGYSFYRTPEAEAGLVVGVHVTKFNILLQGSGSVNGSVVSTRTEQQDKTVPLPTLGIYGAYAFAPNWMTSGRVDVLSLKVRDYKGKLWNLQGNLLYRFTPNVALGMGYRYVDYSLEAHRPDWDGTLDYTFSGPQAFVDVGF